MVLMRSSLGILSVFEKVQVLLHATVKGMEGKSARRSRVYSVPRLLEAQVTRRSSPTRPPVTDPVTCLLGTFPNIPPTLNASRSKLITKIKAN